MGIILQMTAKQKTTNFSEKFNYYLNNCNKRSDYLDLLHWIIAYYSDTANEKEHMIITVLSVVYSYCPEAFFDYVKDMDAMEWEFMKDVKIMFEDNYFEESKIIKWRNELLLNPVNTKLSNSSKVSFLDNKKGASN